MFLSLDCREDCVATSLTIRTQSETLSNKGSSLLNLGSCLRHDSSRAKEGFKQGPRRPSVRRHIFQGHVYCRVTNCRDNATEHLVAVSERQSDQSAGPWLRLRSVFKLLSSNLRKTTTEPHARGFVEDVPPVPLHSPFFEHADQQDFEGGSGESEGSKALLPFSSDLPTIVIVRSCSGTQTCVFRSINLLP